MNRWLFCLLVLTLAVSFPRRCPAPIIFRPGEGWTYEPVGQVGKWQRDRARDQLEVAEQAFADGQNRLALKAAKRTLKVWPLSDFAGPAQYLVGRIYESRRLDERAFREYQRTLDRHPRMGNYDDILHRQMGIADRFLAGQWFRLWGYIPFYPSMDKTARLYGTIVTNGPFHSTGPIAQMKVGEAREKQKNYALAVRAYERAADRYYDQPEVAAEALYRAGMAWNQQSKKADYDQSASFRAIDTLNEFKELYRGDRRVPEATQVILDLKAEQARGAFETARFYERYRRFQGALVYYNEVLVTDPDSPFAEPARERIERLKPRAAAQVRRQEERDAAAGASRPPSAAPPIPQVPPDPTRP